MILNDPVAQQVTEQALNAAERDEPEAVLAALQDAAAAELLDGLVIEWSRWTAAAARTREIAFNAPAPLVMSREASKALWDLHCRWLADDGGRDAGTGWLGLTDEDRQAAAGALVYRLHHALGLIGGLAAFQRMLAVHQAVAEPGEQTEACAWGAALVTAVSTGQVEHGQWLAGPLLAGYRHPHILLVWLRLAWLHLRAHDPRLLALDPDTGLPTRWIDPAAVRAAASAADADPQDIAVDFLAQLAKAAADNGQPPALGDDLTDEVKISITWLLAANLAHRFTGANT